MLFSGLVGIVSCVAYSVHDTKICMEWQGGEGEEEGLIDKMILHFGDFFWG